MRTLRLDVSRSSLYDEPGGGAILQVDQAEPEGEGVTCRDRFVGTPRNGVMAELWMATCIHLLLSCAKSEHPLAWSRRLLRVVQFDLVRTEIASQPLPRESPSAEPVTATPSAFRAKLVGQQ